MSKLSMAQYYANAQTIFDFWTSNGFTPEQSCGLLAQADAESSLNPSAVGDHGQAFGLFQLHPGRCDLIKQGTGFDISKLPDVVTQLHGILFELHHTEHHALAKIQETTTAYDAGYAACKFYERPGAPGQAEKRGANAQKWFSHFRP